MESIAKTRRDEILRWLERRVTIDEAITEIRHDEDHIARVAIREPWFFRLIWIAIGGLLVDLYWRIHEGPRRPDHELFRDWASQFDLSRAELWRYDTGGDSWENLRGQCGYAVFEKGEISGYWVSSEN